MGCSYSWRECSWGKVRIRQVTADSEGCAPQYIPNTEEVEGMDPARPYRSIISWPIQRNGEGQPLGIVNIDSVNKDAFGPLSEDGDEDREAARLLCSDILIGIGIALLDAKCFHCSGARV